MEFTPTVGAESERHPIQRNINYSLLLEQRNFLLEFPWQDGKTPEEIDGIVNLLEAIYDTGVPII